MLTKIYILLNTNTKVCVLSDFQEAHRLLDEDLEIEALLRNDNDMDMEIHEVNKLPS